MLQTLQQAVERAAGNAPEHEAVRFNGTTLSYAELDERSNRLARTLLESGVRRGERVGILSGKGLHSAVAIYGIMKAGAAYVPLDPGAPDQRLRVILADCGIRHLVSEPSRSATLMRLTAEGAKLDAVVGTAPDTSAPFDQIPWEQTAAVSGDAPGVPLTKDDLAYVLYTSGSTGVPKGVTHTHASALAFAEVAARTYGLKPDDRVSNHAPLHFDLSTLDFFATAVAGATTVIIPEAYTKLPASLSGLIEKERLTVLYTVPLALTHLVLHGALESRDLTSLRWVLFGGEPFPPKHLAALMSSLPGARFSNVYGPTEVNGITYWILPGLPDKSESVPIGIPYGDVELQIVDKTGQKVHPGEAGELFAHTRSMMKGYWGRPDLDRDVFDTRKGRDGADVRFLRTGDLVRAREDGALVFLGRKDRQVKARGYRVELDEVEFALAGHPDVETAAVYTVPDEDGSHAIRAAVMLRSGATATASTLVAHVGESLPQYAVPDVVEVVTGLPRTSTGKIDRLALQTQALTQGASVR